MAGQGFGIVLEMWKVTKTVNVRLQRTNNLIPYRILFEDKHVLSETEAETQKYDKIAFVQFLGNYVNLDVHVLGRNPSITRLCGVLVAL
jgi:hypothetical protein